MDKKNKIFFVVLFLLIAGSIGATYWRIVLKKNYIIEAQVDCDPGTENCFVWECDPESKVEGEACTGDPEADIWYYKIQQRKAGNMPLCNPDEDEACEPFVCEQDEKDCQEVLCNDENKIEQEVECNSPEEYLKNNPSEEEGESEEKEGEEAEAEVEETEKDEEVEGTKIETEVKTETETETETEVEDEAETETE